MTAAVHVRDAVTLADAEEARGRDRKALTDMNLFLATRALTDAREDHLTEFFAAALEHVPAFSKAYLEFVLGEYAQNRRWGKATITGIETQAQFADEGCRPDMILRLSNGKRVACEHKLLAPETHGTEEDPRPQLERYLELPIDALVYVRSSWRPPGKTVLSHPKYIKPADREHFLWRDFFHLLKPGQHVLVDWLREGFETLNFTPPRPKVGDLDLRPDEEKRDDALNFAKLWGRTKSVAHTLGWRVGTGSRIELYMYLPRALASEVFVSPAQPERFLFRVTPVPGQLERVRVALTAATTRMPQRASVSVKVQKRAAGPVQVLDVVTTRDDVLPCQADSAEVLEERLLAYIEPLMRAIPAQS